MEIHVVAVRSFYLTGKQLFNDNYAIGDKIIVGATMLTMTASFSISILNLTHEFVGQFFCFFVSFFLFFLMIKFTQQLDIKLMRSKYSIYIEEWNHKYFSELQKREFFSRLSGYLGDMQAEDVLKIEERFLLLGIKSTSYIYKGFLTGCIIFFSAVSGMLYFLYSEAPFSLKWEILKIFLLSSFFILFVTIYVFLIYKQQVKNRKTKDRQIAEWIKEFLRQRGSSD